MQIPMIRNLGVAIEGHLKRNESRAAPVNGKDFETGHLPRGANDNYVFVNYTMPIT